MALVIEWKNFSMSYRLDKRQEGDGIAARNLAMIRSIIELINDDGFSTKELGKEGAAANFNWSQTNGDTAGYTGSFITSQINVGDASESLSLLAERVKANFPIVGSSYGVAIRIQTDTVNQTDFPRDKTKLEALARRLKTTLEGDFKDPHITVIDGTKSPCMYIQIHHQDLEILDTAIKLIKLEYDRAIGTQLAA